MDKRERKHLLFASALGLVAFLSSTFAFLRVPDKDEANADWMSGLADSTSLSRVSLPGTHDSGATVPLYDLAGKCQDASIAEQLNYGARFLDVRLKATQDQLSLYHGFIDQQQNFDTVLSTCYLFLRNHPTETIVMSIQEEQKSSACTETFEALLQKEIALEPESWYTANAIPVLSSVRSKIVLLSRYENPTIGLNCNPTSWQVNATFDLNNGVAFHIQDTYKVTSNDLKWNEAQDCLAYSSALSADDVFVINFMSGYLDKPIGPLNLAVAAPTAQYVNPLAKSQIPSHPFVGIVLFDFLTADLASAVIGVNQ